MLRLILRSAALMLALLLPSGCGRAPFDQPEDFSPTAVSYMHAVTIEQADLEDEMTALSDAPAALPTMLISSAPGTLEKRNNKAVIDYSNTRDGYVMVQYTASTDKRLKAQVKGPATTYTYNLTVGQWAAFPLSDGNGTYQFVVYENIEGTKYACVLSQSYVYGLLAVGERSGRTEEALSSLAAYYENRVRLDRRLRFILLYPAILLLIMLAVLVVLLTQVLPVFNDVYANLGSRLSGLAGGLLALDRVLDRAMSDVWYREPIDGLQNAISNTTPVITDRPAGWPLRKYKKSPRS